MDPELTVTKAFPARGLRWWIAWATSSLPVPDSPSIRIVDFDGAAIRTSSKTRCIGADFPTIRSRPRRWKSSARRRRVLLGEPTLLAPLRTVRMTSSFWNGFGM